jgi:hypothetical protein
VHRIVLESMGATVKLRQPVRPKLG